MVAGNVENSLFEVLEYNRLELAWYFLSSSSEYIDRALHWR